MREQNRNLAVRVVSALVLFPFAVWMTWLGGPWFAVLVGIVAALSAAELVLMFEKRLPPTGWLGILVAAMAQEGELTQAPRSAALGVLAWAYTGLLPAAVVALREDAGWQWVVLLFVVTWANDTLAYFTGRFLGKRPFAPRISPRKTWEGFWGGAAGSVLGALAVKALFLPDLPVPAAALVGAGAAVLGPLGDLAESMLKRAAGVKDSGRVVPGHGGLLDRIDAILFVAPWVVACSLWFQR